MSQKVKARWRVMVKLHEQCDAPGEVIGVTLKYRGGGGFRKLRQRAFSLKYVFTIWHKMI